MSLNLMSKPSLAVVTGASRGIGRATALSLAEAGYEVVGVFRREKEAAEEVSARLQKLGSTGLMIQADLSDGEDVARVFKAVRERFGDPEVLVNNAAMDYYGLAQDMAYETWQKLFRVNVDGVFLCTQEVLKPMIAKGKGSIVNLSSIWGSRSAAMETAYAATKGAVEAFTRSLAVEVAASGVRVNAVAPGVVDTDMMRCFDQETCRSLCTEIPMQRFATADEVARSIRFLCSQEASYMTGQILKVDGGFLA